MNGDYNDEGNWIERMEDERLIYKVNLPFCEREENCLKTLGHCILVTLYRYKPNSDLGKLK